MHDLCVQIGFWEPLVLENALSINFAVEIANVQFNQ
jgi:hypothetical protein